MNAFQLYSVTATYHMFCYYRAAKTAPGQRDLLVGV